MQQSDPLIASLAEWMEVSRRRTMHDLIQYARANELSMSHLGSLIHLHHKGSCAVKGLADHLDVSNAAASQMLGRLVQDGIVRREEDPSDRRAKRIILTEKGSQMVQEGLLGSQSWMHSLADALTTEEKEQVQNALSILIRKARMLSKSTEARSE